MGVKYLGVEANDAPTMKTTKRQKTSAQSGPAVAMTRISFL